MSQIMSTIKGTPGNQSSSKQLVEKFEGQFKCLGENAETHTTFLLSIEKHKNGKAIKYKIRFFDSVIFVTNSL